VWSNAKAEDSMAEQYRKARGAHPCQGRIFALENRRNTAAVEEFTYKKKRQCTESKRGTLPITN
jgi:hypothetical protein